MKICFILVGTVLNVVQVHFIEFMKLVVLLFFSFFTGLVNAQSTTYPSTVDLDSVLLARGSAPVGKPFPAFNETTTGGLFSNKQLAGKVVLLNFWFEGCAPCMAEMKALQQLYDQFKENPDFLFISITWERTEVVKRVKKKYNLNFRVITLSPETCNRLNFGNGYPINIILNRKGIVQYVQVGGPTEPGPVEEYLFSRLVPRIRNEL